MARLATSNSRRTVLSRAISLAGLLGLLLVPHPLPAQVSAVSEEYRLKAVFVYRFPQFVDWPAEALEGRTRVDICVTRPNPFGRSLQDLAEGEQLAGRPMAVREIDPAAPLDDCHVLFVSSTGATLRRVLMRAVTLPVLTVGEGSEFLEAGGIIRLRLVDRRIRFDVNAAAAARARLRLRSQLLQLALEVRGT